MTRSSRVSASLACAALLVASLGAQPAAAQNAAASYTNLQVLPADISPAELGEIMLANLQGLGLRRRTNEGCLHCHAGSMDEPRNTWDYASDEKPAKETARMMMAMVREINSGFLNSLEHRSTPEVRVTCVTCHAGRINPMPLPELLVTEYEDSGLDALTRTYRSARSRTTRRMPTTFGSTRSSTSPTGWATWVSWTTPAACTSSTWSSTTTHRHTAG